MPIETIQRIAGVLRQEYGAGAEQYALDQLKKWATLNAPAGTMVTWVDILSALGWRAAVGEKPQG